MKQIDITMENFFKNNQLVTEPIVLTAGYFDGIHIGHQKLLETATQEAKTKEIKTAVLTFEFPQALKIEKQKKHRNNIFTLEDKRKAMEGFFFDYFIVIHLTEEFMNIEATQFIEQLVKRINIDTFVVGIDYRFGFGGRGDKNLLNKLGEQHQFSTIFVEPIDAKNGGKVSSSAIRLLIETGDVEQANNFLVHPYSIQGIVVHGKQQGRLLGFPTANITNTGEYLVPKQGIYIVNVFIQGQKYNGVCNIGHAPTIKNEIDVVVETNIFNFTTEIYGEDLVVVFRKKIRDELKFDGIDALKQQIQLDVEAAKTYFNTETY